MIVARHAVSVLTARGIVNGDPGVADKLTPEGIDQARTRLAPVLAENPPDVCITSRFIRTRQTAETALRGAAVRMETDPTLDDLEFGDMEGEPLADYRAWYRNHGPDRVPPGAVESRRTTMKRYQRAFSRIADRPESRVLVVAHGLAVTYLIRSATGASLDGFIQPADHAEPHVLGLDSLRRALSVLDTWTSSTEPTS